MICSRVVVWYGVQRFKGGSKGRWGAKSHLGAKKSNKNPHFDFKGADTF